MEIIAEIGQNHNGDIDLALELIHKAKECGADAAKFQLYDAKALFPQENNEWYNYNLKTEISWNQLSVLAAGCKSVDIEMLVSVFDPERVHWAEGAGVMRYKIASRSIHDTELLRAVVLTGKPMIVSLGMWDGHKFPIIEGAKKLDFLYCVSKYPTSLSDVRLANVDFNAYSGFSDHSTGITAALAALARGARILEKHFTLDKNMYGPDHSCSMTPDELRRIHDFRSELAQCL